MTIDEAIAFIDEPGSVITVPEGSGPAGVAGVAKLSQAAGVLCEEVKRLRPALTAIGFIVEAAKP